MKKNIDSIINKLCANIHERARESGRGSPKQYCILLEWIVHLAKAAMMAEDETRLWADLQDYLTWIFNYHHSTKKANGDLMTSQLPAGTYDTQS